MIRAVMTEARELGYRSINMDLIYGLPFQTLESFDRTLDTTNGMMQKMAEGGFVSPDDRLPWAYAIRDWLTDQARQGNSTVVVSLGLGRRARDIFREAEGFVFFVHVEGTQDVIRERIRRKTGKLPDADEDEVLRRQYAELERLRADEPGVRVDATREPEVLADAALVALSVARKAGVDN